MRITVGIGPRLLESGDGGRSWSEGTRVVPPRSEPAIRGPRERLILPALTAGEWSAVHIAPDGFGFAAGWEPVVSEDRKSIARFRLTNDGGASWQIVQPAIGFWGRLRAWGGWPPEQIDSVAVLVGGVLAFAWEDPWLFDGPNCHLVYSSDRGAHWRYMRLPDNCNWLPCGLGPLRVFSDGRLVEWSEATRRCESIELDWKRPPDHRQAALPLRSAQFLSDTEGYALVVSWPRDDSAPTLEQLSPPLVGLARTQDGGRRWSVVQSWEGPRKIDLNVRHVVTLELQLP